MKQHQLFPFRPLARVLLVLAGVSLLSSCLGPSIEGHYRVTIQDTEWDSLRTHSDFADKLFGTLGQLLRVEATFTRDSVFWAGGLGKFDFPLSIEEAPVMAYRVRGDSVFCITLAKTPGKASPCA